MTDLSKRTADHEMDVEKNFGFDPKELDPNEMLKPRDDDTFSPLHEDEDGDGDGDETGNDAPAEPAEKPT